MVVADESEGNDTGVEGDSKGLEATMENKNGISDDAKYEDKDGIGGLGAGGGRIHLDAWATTTSIGA